MKCAYCNESDPPPDYHFGEFLHPYCVHMRRIKLYWDAMQDNLNKILDELKLLRDMGKK